MLDSDLISIGELLDIFKEKRLEFNNQAKMKLLSFVENGLEPLFFYKGQISRKAYRQEFYNDKHILQNERIIGGVCGYLVLHDNDFNNLLFNDIDFLCYPVSESENYPLVGSYLPTLSNYEEYEEKCEYVLFYAIDFELSITDVLFRKGHLNRFLKWKELKKTPKTTKNNNKNDETTTLKAQLDQAHARIAELEQQLNEQPTSINPVANITQEMQIINDVYHTFWENHNSKEIPPKKETITNWIIENYNTTGRMANAIDSITRPPKHRQGGQKAR